MLNMYSVYDEVGKTYSNPLFTDVRDDHCLAIRIIKGQMYDPSNMLAMFPDNYTLYYLGQFNEINGSIDAIEPIKVITCEDALKELREERNVQE